jgi:glyoxylase-like metal-dependent hydrolase (beta-lactamase superfamily II)
MFSAPGHREGHSALMLDSKEDVLLHITDAIVHPLLIENPRWFWTILNEIKLARKTKLDLIVLAERRCGLIFGSHLPFPGLGRVAKDSQKWVWSPVGTFIERLAGNQLAPETIGSLLDGNCLPQVQLFTGNDRPSYGRPRN